MWSQLIFFAAIALVIIILVRKSANLGRVGVPKLNLAFLSKFINYVISTINILFSSLGRKLKRSKNSTAGVRRANNYAFWEEESPSSRIEVSSHLEEAEKMFKKGNLDQAEKLFIKAATSNPGDPKVYARLGLLYLQQKNYSDAIESLKVAAKLDKYNPSRHYNLSLAYMGNGDTQKAIASVREAITLDPVTQKYRQLLEQLLNG